MKQKYLSPEAKITLLEVEVFLQASVEKEEDILFEYGWN